MRRWLTGILALVIACSAAAGVLTIGKGRTNVPVPGGGGGGGDLIHGSSASVSGTFTSKTIREAIFDRADHGDSITTRWSDYWPTSPAGYELRYTTPASLGRGVSTPGSRMTHYLAGAHNGTGAFAGNNVGVWRTFTRTLGDWSYWSWWERVDPNWSFGDDDNYKTYGYSTGTTIYELPNNWYAQFENSTWTSGSVSPLWNTNDDSGTTGLDPAVIYASNTQPSPTGAWVHHEILSNWQSGSTGHFYSWHNGLTGFSRNGNIKTDGYSGTQRSEGIAGYARNRSTNNWRYLSNIIYSRGTSPARLYLADNATWASSTASTRTPQLITSMTSSTINYTVNGGTLAAGTYHLHLRDEVNGHQYLGSVTLQ